MHYLRITPKKKDAYILNMIQKNCEYFNESLNPPTPLQTYVLSEITPQSSFFFLLILSLNHSSSIRGFSHILLTK